MAIYEDVSSLLKEAMLARDKERTMALRNVRAALLNAAKETGASTVSDEVAVGVLRSLAKQRTESAEQYGAGGRPDLAEAELSERAIIETFLPRLADEAQTRVWVTEAIAAIGATRAQEAGRVTGAVMKAHKGEVDGTLVKTLASELLGG